MSRQHRWTYAELRRARDLQAQGLSVRQIANLWGTSRAGLERALYRHTPGQGPGHVRGAICGKVSPERAVMYRRAMELRRQGLMWSDVAEAVGYPGDPKGLYSAVKRYRRKIGSVFGGGQ